MFCCCCFVVVVVVAVTIVVVAVTRDEVDDVITADLEIGGGDCILIEFVFERNEVALNQSESVDVIE